MSDRYFLVKEYYDGGLWTKAQVRNAVTNPKNEPWITAEEYEKITGEPY